MRRPPAHGDVVDLPDDDGDEAGRDGDGGDDGAHQLMDTMLSVTPLFLGGLGVVWVGKGGNGWQLAPQ